MSLTYFFKELSRVFLDFFFIRFGGLHDELALIFTFVWILFLLVGSLWFHHRFPCSNYWIFFQFLFAELFPKGSLWSCCFPDTAIMALLCWLLFRWIQICILWFPLSISLWFWFHGSVRLILWFIAICIRWSKILDVLNDILNT